MNGFITRRNFAAAAAAIAGAAIAAPALAEEVLQPVDGGPAIAEFSEDVVIPGPSRLIDDSTPAWLGEAPEFDESDITAEWNCDVLVVGAGTAGLFAACSAAEEGASVVLIDKCPMSPGIRGTIGGINTRYQAAEGVVIDKNALCHELEMYAANNLNPRLVRVWADESGETVDWYGDLCEKVGRSFMLNSDADLEPGETVYRHWATGHAAVANGFTTEDGTVLLDYAAELGVESHFACAMQKLEQDETGRVTGIIAIDEDDNVVRVNAAKGVIVCTGGYGRNDEMMAALQPETCKIFSSNSAFPGTTGDGIKACLWVGAAFDDVHTSMLFDRCPLRPDELAGGDLNTGMFWMSSQPWLKVNLEGERFCNESEPYDLTLHASLHQPGHTYAVLWDDNFLDQIFQFKTQGCSRMFPFANGAPVSAVNIDACMGMNMGLTAAGYIQEADTIEELAEKLNIPAEAMAATVARYNELCEAGYDEDFGKEPFRMAPLTTAPFRGVRVTGYMLCTLDGIRIDTQMRALNKDGVAIEGLYVAGNDSGSYFTGTYPDLVPGAAAGRTATFGRRAGKVAARS